ncbi:MAG TPA: Holliday junction resolvase RuvX [Chloroflexota bacterium]|nr:Holliday junction resolvase RuvX [Chloroflexota bacterium]
MESRGSPDSHHEGLTPQQRNSILALDVGDRRIGLASSDPMRVLASPGGVIVRSTLERDLEQVLAAIEEHEIGTVVVGLPFNMGGSEGTQAQKTRKFAAALASRGVAVELWDERLTTVEAIRILEDQGMKRKRIRRHVDEVAATLILDAYLRSLGSRPAKPAEAYD